MNNIFQFDRFGKVLLKDLKEYFPKYGLSMITTMGILIGFWILCFLFPSDIKAHVDTRGILSVIIVIIGTMVAPFKLYGKANHSKLGISYAMLPASTLEKFLSMFINCALITPIVLITGSILLDSVLALVSFNVDQGFIFNEIGFGKLFKHLYDLIVIQTFFIFGNMYFRRQKMSKTIISLIVIVFAISLIGVKITQMMYESGFLGFDFDNFKYLLNDDLTLVSDMLDRKIKVLYYSFVVIFEYLIPAGMLFGTYYKIQTQKY